MAVFTWDGVRDTDGAVVDSDWSTAANWVGDAVPSAGATLVFPSGVPAARLATTNNFSEGTQFASILVSGAGYTLAGNPLELTSGLQAIGGGTTTITTPLTLTGNQGISASSGTLAVNAPLDLDSYTLTVDAAAGAQLILHEEISGSGGLIKTGSGTAILAAANSYAGITAVDGGVLTVRDAAALGAGNSTAATGTQVSSGATLRLDGSSTILGEQLALGSDTTTGTLQVLSDVVWAEDIVLSNGGWKYFNVAPGKTFEVGGSLTLSAAGDYPYLSMEGGGRIVLSGASNLHSKDANRGQIQIAPGTTLQVDGSLTGYAAMNVSGTLRGKGTVGHVSFTTNSNARLAVDLNEDASATGHDQLKVDGAVDLSGAALQVNLGYLPDLGTVFTILANDGSDAITGTLAGLPEGGLMAVGSTVLQISYTGGSDDNDITLTRVNAAIWDGMRDGGGISVDSAWNTAANWVGDAVPSTGATLVFPSGVPAARLATTNNFSEGTQFASILVSGAGYTLAGNPLELTSGLQAIGGGTTTITTPLTLAGDQGMSASSGTLAVNAPLDLDSHTLTVDAAAGARLILHQEISGSGGLIKTGSGTAILAAANSYAGITAIDGGILTVRDAAALGAGDATAATGTQVSNGAILRLDGSSTILGEPLALGVDGTIGILQVLSDSTWDGSIVIGSQPRDYFNVSSGKTLKVSGSLSSTAAGDYPSFYVYGGGTVVLSGASDFSVNNSPRGQLEVGAGTTLEVNDRFVGYDHSTITGTLRGSGTVSVLNDVRGTIAPGSGPSGIGTLTTGSATFQADSNGRLVVDLNGDAPGTGHDQLKVDGAVDLSGAALQVNLGYLPDLGTVFTILANDGSDAITGTLAGLPEGGLMAVGSTVLQISYTGGSDDNDITLTRVNAAIWDGMRDGGGISVDSDWSTAANWVGDAVPSAGATLVFPSGVPAARLATTNNFSEGTQFASILVSGAGYTLAGNPLELTSGLQAIGGGTTTITTPLTLTGNQGMSASSGTLAVNAPLDLDSYTLTVDAAAGAQLILHEEISGSGGLIKTGSGTAILAATNSYAGITAVDGGVLTVRDAAALGAGDATASTGTTINNHSGGMLQLDGSFTVAGEQLTINSSGGTVLQVLSDVVWAEDIVLSNGGWKYFNVAPGKTFEVGGSLTLSAAGDYPYLSMEGGGRIVLSGTSNLHSKDANRGQIQIAPGTTLQVDGSLTGYAAMNVSGTLRGKGTVGHVSFTTNSNARLAVDLNEDASGTGHDQLKVDGAVDLSGAALQVNLGYLPDLGTVFTILDNDGSDPITGTFGGISEGALVNQAGSIFRVSYVGGEAHKDVTLELIYLNHAPTLAAVQPDLGVADENEPKTIALASFLNDGSGTTAITDIDPNTVLGGIALTGISGQGTWSYSLDGVSFTSIDAVSDEQALLLGAATQLRYQPVGEFAETVTVTYRAWDRSTGTAGTRVDATRNGIASPFSSATDTASLAVTDADVNVAPTIALGGPAAVDEGNEYTLTLGAITDPGGNTVKRYIIHWGDGETSTFDAADRPADGNISHVYADGTVLRTISVTLVDEDGEHAGAGSKSIVVNNAAPTATLSNGGLVTYGQATGITISNPFDQSIADTLAGFHYAYALDADALNSVTYADGSTDTFYSATFSAGSHTIYARIIDKDGSYSQYQTTVVVTKADAVIQVAGVAVTYDGNAHGASGMAMGVHGEPLSGLDLGASFTDAPGGTAHWTFIDVTGNYNDASGSAEIDIARRAITVTAQDQRKAYDEEDPPLTYEITSGSLVAVDEFFGDLARRAGEDAGRYGISQGSLKLSDNYDLSFVDAELAITRGVLTGNARTQGALNMAKNGKLKITVTDIQGFENGDNAEGFLNNASFWITIGAERYQFVPASVTAKSGSSLSISCRLKDSDLQQDLAGALESATSGATALDAGFSMESENYSFSDDYTTRIFSTVKKKRR